MLIFGFYYILDLIKKARPIGRAFKKLILKLSIVD